VNEVLGRVEQVLNISSVTRPSVLGGHQRCRIIRRPLTELSLGDSSKDGSTRYKSRHYCCVE
jgi:hypothetical protein